MAYREWWKSRIINGYEKTLGSDKDVCYLDGGNGFTGVIYVKTYQLYTLKMYSLLYVNYTSIKL